MLAFLHAPVKGATDHLEVSEKPLDFNPRTREVATLAAALSGDDPMNFNPRTREGCDIMGCGGTRTICI